MFSHRPSPRLTRILLLVIACTLLLGVIPQGSAFRPTPAEAQRVPPGGAPAAGTGPQDTTAQIRVIDGETIETLINGQRTGVALVGIDAPQGNTDCGRQAAAALREMVKNGLHLE